MNKDLYLFHEGTLYQSYRWFGAHPAQEEGQTGVRFTVWAPHAAKVSLASNIYGWTGNQQNTLIRISESGIWSRFFPDMTEGTIYKYEITDQHGKVRLKSDPFAFHAEVRPATASIVKSIGNYAWSDAAWRRKKRDLFQLPVNIYELHFGTWRQKANGELYSYRDMAELLIPYVVKMGYTHIEIMPLTEHPYDLSWGYQSTGYFAPTSRYGEPEDLMYFVDQCHAANIGVLLDWVPGHFTKDDHGLRRFDGTPLYEYADPAMAEKPGWGTLSFDFGKPEVRSFLISSALYWLDLYHFDGLRVDAVTSMLRLDFEKGEGEYVLNQHGGVENLEAISFLKDLNQAVFQNYPYALMMAEESSSWPGVTTPVHEGGLGFNYKWNMGWMNDTLAYMETDFTQRPEQHNLLTFPLWYAYSENFTLPLSHDEVVHGKRSLLDKMPGSYEQKFEGLRLLLGYLMTFPGKKLLFMGGEFGQFIEWRDQGELDWFLLDYDSHAGLQQYTAALNQLYLHEPALWELDHIREGYEWINPDDAGQSVICYLRKGKKTKDTLLIVINFQPVARPVYRVGVPKPGRYEQIFSSVIPEMDARGQKAAPVSFSEQMDWHQQQHSLELALAPLSFSVWKRNGKLPTSKKGRTKT